MDTLKQHIIDDIIHVEGGFVDDPNDSGGATNYGITEAVARSYGYTGHMRDLPRSVAFDIYVAKYWDAVLADKIRVISNPVAAEVVDTAVNMGTGRAGTFLQRSLNVLNDRGRLYPDIKIDGRIGPGTISALESLVKIRGDATLVKMLNCLQGAFYVDLAERREKDEKFINGWFKNRVQ